MLDVDLTSFPALGAVVRLLTPEALDYILQPYVFACGRNCYGVRNLSGGSLADRMPPNALAVENQTRLKCFELSPTQWAIEQ